MMKKKILIVDDEQDVVIYLTTLLNRAGYQPTSLSSVTDFISETRRAKPHLICLDIMMPEESGLSLYRKLKKDVVLKDIPVLIISGVARDSEFDFRSYVPDETVPLPDFYLEKPIVIDDFLRVVGQLTSGAGASLEKGVNNA